MAVIQISKIQHRRGLNADLPQLSSAELGWVVDQRKLYIGNGTTSEGAPAIGNTEILTQYSDILGSINSYTYKGTDVGYVAQTNQSGADIQRSLQAKLDDFVNAKDFGIIGDGVTDYSAQINFMLNQVYSREHTNTKSFKTIYFPAGTYLVSANTLKFPRNAHIVGSGPNSTLFKKTGTAGVLAQTADSKGQTGANIGLGGALGPKNISFQSLQFFNETDADVFLIDQGNVVNFHDVRFKGRHSANQTTILNRKAGVRVTETTSGDSKIINFTNCDFTRTDLAFESDHDIDNVKFDNCYLHDLYTGIIVGENITGVAPSITGPTGMKVLNSLFKRVYHSGIKTVTVTNFVSSHNTFKNVGHAGIEVGATPVAPVINYDADGNYSIGDAFDRTASQQATHPNIQNNNKAVFGLIASDSLEYGTIKQEPGKTMALTDNTSASTNTTIDFDEATLTDAIVEFAITRGSAKRTGHLRIAGNNTAGYSFEQDFTENADVGVGFTMDSTNGTVQYTTTSTGANATLNYRTTKFN
tara:strand:+ start:749 stop:2332 length:1584 start_codon:yes stop_codon:yes gene_type:complete